MNSTIYNENMMQVMVAMIADAIAAKVAAILAESETKFQSQSVEKHGLYTVAQAAAYLGDISERKLRSMVSNEEIPHRRIGTRLMFTKEDLDTYVNKKAKRPARF